MNRYLRDYGFIFRPFESKSSSKSSEQTKTVESTNDLTSTKDSEDSAQTDRDLDSEVIDNIHVFKVEKILDQRKINGKQHFLIKWVGFPDNQNTWEPKENIFDKALIKNFVHSRKSKKKHGPSNVQP